MKGYLSVTFQDSFGQTTTRQYELAEGVGGNVGTRLNNLRAKAITVLNAIQALTGLKIISTSLNIYDAEFVITSLTPEVNSNISDDGVMSVALMDGGKGYIRLPSPKANMIDLRGRPNASLAEWQTFVGAFANGAAGTISDGESVNVEVGTSGIIRTWRASRGRRNS